MAKNARKINIDQAFILYCTPNEGRMRSIKDVAESMGCSTQYLEKLSSKHSWVKRRETIREKTQKAAELSIIEHVDATNKDQLDKWSRVEAFVMDVLDEQMAFRNGSKPETKTKRFSIYAISEMVNALKEASKMKRVILLLPTEVSKADVTNLNKNVELPKDQIDEMQAFVEKNGAKLDIPAPAPAPENQNQDAQPQATH